MPSAKRLSTIDSSVIGGTGLGRTGFITDDFIPALWGEQGAKKYREMSDNDPVIGGILYAIETVIRGVQWRVEPNARGGALSEDGREFVEQCLFMDMSHTWEDFISEVLTMLIYGYDVHEIVWKIRQGPDATAPERRSLFTDGRIGIRKLAPRPQETIYEWIMESDGGIQGVKQMLIDNLGEVTLPIEKILHFRTSTRRGNPEGRSLLRNCYRPYERKQVIETAEGRACLRSAGIMELSIPAEYMAGDADTEQKKVLTAYKNMATALAQDKQGSVVIPSDTWENGKPMFGLRIVTADSRRPADLSGPIERYDKRMAGSLLADFMLLGQQSVGSFALSSDKTQLFRLSLESILNMIAAPINRYLLPRLWKLNAFDPNLIPVVKPGDVTARALDELGSYLLKLSQAGMPLFPDEELENSLRSAGKLPDIDPKIREEVLEANSGGGDGSADEDEQGGEEDDEPDDEEDNPRARGRGRSR